MIHHFFSPHRDDVLLTFGGHIINLISKSEPVVVHVIFGQDGYLRPQFLDKLKKQEANHAHVKHLITLLNLNEVEYSHKIKAFLRENSNNSLHELGILIRHLEEKSVEKITGYELREYDFPCAYPLRGYLTFNDELREDDYKIHQEKLVDESDNLRKLLNPNLIEPDDDVALYFPSGIGGHPDHIIMARIGVAMSLKYPDRVKFGQDLPYSLVQEWFCRSPLPFGKVEKKIIDISKSLQKKMELLSLYKSQLSVEDLRLAEIYPKYIGGLISREFKLGGDFEHLADRNIPIEIQYQFKHV